MPRHDLKFVCVSLAAAVLGSALWVSGAQAADEAPAAADAAPKTENCIDTMRIRNQRVLDDKTILFYMSGGTIYKVDLPYKCPQLGFEQSFRYVSQPAGKLCSTDIITVMISSGRFDGASCGLAPFQPMTKEAADKLIADIKAAKGK